MVICKNCSHSEPHNLKGGYCSQYVIDSIFKDRNYCFCNKFELGDKGGLKQEMKVLELFSGTESFSKVAREKGYQTFTIDNDISFHPNLCVDILALDSNLIKVDTSWDNIDIIWASPPCTCFSVASISTHWKGGFRKYIPKTNEAEISLELIKKTLNLIDELSPTFWYIENPIGMLRKMPMMKRLPRRVSVTYCQYGDNRMKPTDIWTNNLSWIPRPKCKNGSPCHESAPRGSKTGTQGLNNAKERAKIPKELCLEILKSMETKANVQTSL